jgi:pyruvate dehydrogenase complex dehydrogenase (E1) component
VNSLKSRISRIETGIDVARLSDEQLKRLDFSRPSREQVQSLDIARLTDEQVVKLDFKDLTAAQLAAVSKDFDEKFPEMAAVIESMADEELTAIKEWRLCPWHPGYRGEFGA